MDTQPSKRRKLEDSRSHIGSRDAYTETFEPTAPVSSTIRNPSGLKTSTYISSRPSQPAATMYSDGSYHSNIFKLQLGELIKKITPKYETQTIHAEKALHRLRDIIEHIPDREGLPVCQPFSVFGCTALSQPNCCSFRSPMRKKPSRRPVTSVFPFQILVQTLHQNSCSAIQIRLISMSLGVSLGKPLFF